GTAIAYISREAKDRGVYVLRDGQPARRLINYGDDEGQDMSDAPAVSAHGGAVAYVHGSRMNKQGEFADPVSRADLPVQQVWIIGSDGSDAPRLLGAGKDPIFTPDEKFILWRASGKVMAAELVWEQGRLKGAGNPFEFLSGMREDMRFSPDGGKIAYVRGGGVEVYDFATKTAIAVPHGADVDGGPIWSPDGASIAFRREAPDSPNLLRNSCGRSRYCGPDVVKQPWAIWTVSVADLQQPKKIWQAKPGIGSVFYEMDQAYAPGAHGAQMFWSKSGHIAFSAEGDGWRHLYSVAATGGKARLLTPGAGEVEYATPTTDGSALVYATNIGDLGRRHIGQVAIDGATPAKAVTSGEGNQWDPAPMAGGKIAYVDSDWAHPETVVVKTLDGATTTAAFPKAPENFPSAELVKPELVSFPASDGKAAYGQLFVPKNPNGCAIIFAHGGIRRQMLTGFHYMDAYHYLYGMNQYLAGRGCVVLSVEYRSSIMRGHAFRNAPGWGFTENSEIRDFVGAANWLKKRKDVDAKRGVGIYGLSWGGYMTATALAMHSDIFTVGFDMAGVHITPDAAAMPHSAVGMIDGWTSPVFLAQGDDDMNVDMNDGIALSQALQQKRPQVEFKQQVLPGQTHDLYLSYEQLSKIYTEGSDWLLDHLGVK
ncbi:MAG: WD40-like beta Propeller containing protein, partial [Acidobacteria bacterium]|nr:WD40-like beta Propeller containing protein [Acidobacteriota bacterium]